MDLRRVWISIFQSLLVLHAGMVRLVSSRLVSACLVSSFPSPHKCASHGALMDTRIPFPVISIPYLQFSTLEDPSSSILSPHHLPRLVSALGKNTPSFPLFSVLSGAILVLSVIIVSRIIPISTEFVHYGELCGKPRPNPNPKDMTSQTTNQTTTRWSRWPHLPLLAIHTTATTRRRTKAEGTRFNVMATTMPILRFSFPLATRTRRGTQTQTRLPPTSFTLPTYPRHAPLRTIIRPHAGPSHPAPPPADPPHVRWRDLLHPDWWALRYVETMVSVRVR